MVGLPRRILITIHSRRPVMSQLQPQAQPQTQPALPAGEVAPGIVAGGAPRTGWVAVVHAPLLVLVGVTGVGKSTTLAALAAQGMALHLLPDRRALTDSLMIPAVQAAAGQPVGPVYDRRARFAATRRFRELHPGGMADALALLQVAPQPALLLFDGLRGAHEVAAAAAALPLARFVMLDAPDAVRVARLLGRHDGFDQITTPAAGADLPAGADLLAATGLADAEAQALFSPAERAQLLALVESGAVEAESLRAKLAIVIEEKRNYDPAATRAALLEHAADRALIIDTVRHSAEQAAAQIAAALPGWWPPASHPHPAP